MKLRTISATTTTFCIALLGCSSSGGSGGSSTGTMASSSGSGGGTSSGPGTSSGTASSSGTSASSSGTSATSSGGSATSSSSGSTSTSSSGSGTSSGTASEGGAEVEGTCPTGVVGHCDMGATYPTYSGYTLALVEDFPSAIDLDTDPIFTWSDGSPESGETRFRESQITFSNGQMAITADSTCPDYKNPCIPAGTSYAETALNSNMGSVAAMNVWSGEFRTKYNNYRYGRYEVRYSAPTPNPTYGANPAGNANNGGFLSTMFIFRTPKWSTWNEIDNELEPSIPTNIGTNVVDATGQQHYPAGNADPCPSSTKPNDCPTTAPPAGYANTQTHVYAFEWTSASITWYLDGVAFRTFTGKNGDAIPSKSAKIMMNLWIFSPQNGTPFGDPSKNVYPFHATYDYFRFYKWNNETTYPCSPTPTCLTADDLKDSQNNPSETNYPN